MKYLLGSLLLSLLLISCSGKSIKQKNTQIRKAKLEVYGNTQGTTYSIICNDEIELTKDEVDSLFKVFDQELSTYEDSSFISAFNRLHNGKISYESNSDYFRNCLLMAQKVYEGSDGLFDPSIMPLVDAWSFFKKDHNSIPDSSEVDSLRAFVSFEKENHYDYNFEENFLYKTTPGFRLDFNAIAQGYAVDVLHDYMKSKGAENFYIEIGGEVRVSGHKNDGAPWVIGIDKPEESGKREMISRINLVDKSVATSGNYRKFYEKNGVKYSHTINPKTGYPVQHSLLSATVVAENCALADAYATQFMVMGVDESMNFVKSHPELNLAVYFIFQNKKGRMEVAFNQSFDKLMLKE